MEQCQGNVNVFNFAPFCCLSCLLLDLSSLSPFALTLGLLALRCCFEDFDVMCEADDKGRLSVSVWEFPLEARCCSRETGPVQIDLLSLKQNVQSKAGKPAIHCSRGQSYYHRWTWQTYHREIPGQRCSILGWALVYASKEAVPFGRSWVQRLPSTQASEQSRRVNSKLRLMPRDTGQAWRAVYEPSLWTTPDNNRFGSVLWVLSSDNKQLASDNFMQREWNFHQIGCCLGSLWLLYKWLAGLLSNLEKMCCWLIKTQSHAQRLTIWCTIWCMFIWHLLRRQVTAHGKLRRVALWYWHCTRVPWRYRSNKTLGSKSHIAAMPLLRYIFVYQQQASPTVAIQVWRSAASMHRALVQLQYNCNDDMLMSATQNDLWIQQFPWYGLLVGQGRQSLLIYEMSTQLFRDTYSMMQISKLKADCIPVTNDK